jgi:hypothetical protein
MWVTDRGKRLTKKPVKELMVLKIRTTCVVVIAAILMAASVAFAQDSPVLSQFQVVQENGKEVLKAAKSVSRGDVIEYRAVFVNHHTDGPITNLNLDIPIPAGAIVILSSIEPKNAIATADGKRFSAMPLKIKVKRGDALVEEVVPLSGYKAVRWNVSVLKPGAKAEVSVRVRIS